MLTESRRRCTDCLERSHVAAIKLQFCCQFASEVGAQIKFRRNDVNCALPIHLLLRFALQGPERHALLSQQTCNVKVVGEQKDPGNQLW